MGVVEVFFSAKGGRNCKLKSQEHTAKYLMSLQSCDNALQIETINKKEELCENNARHRGDDT